MSWETMGPKRWGSGDGGGYIMLGIPSRGEGVHVISVCAFYQVDGALLSSAGKFGS